METYGIISVYNSYFNEDLKKRDFIPAHIVFDKDTISINTQTYQEYVIIHLRLDQIEKIEPMRSVSVVSQSRNIEMLLTKITLKDPHAHFYLVESKPNEGRYEFVKCLPIRQDDINESDAIDMILSDSKLSREDIACSVTRIPACQI